MKIEDIAREVATERGCMLWYGNYGILEEIAERYYGRDHMHPINRIATVLSQISRSKYFELVGYINHLGRDYPVFKVIDAA